MIPPKSAKRAANITLEEIEITKVDWASSAIQISWSVPDYGFGNLT